MPARRHYTAEALAARLETQREQARARMQRLRERRRALRERAEAVTRTPPDYQSVPPLESLPLPPPLVGLPLSRIASQLLAFGRGYKHHHARLEKLLRDFPDLDVEEQVADALDWLDDEANRKRGLSLRFLRNWMEIERAKIARRAAQAVRPSGSNGHAPYVQPHTQQGRNPGPPDLPQFAAPVERAAPGELATFAAARRGTPLAERLKALQGGKR